MAKPHTPDLSAIEALENGETRFYAAIGAAMSLAAALELSYFTLFRIATAMPEETAARIFYTIRSAGTQRDLAEAAMKPTLSKAGQDAWKPLKTRIELATGESGHRNFLAHLPVQRSVQPGPFDSAVFSPQAFQTEREAYTVEQDHIQILGGRKKSRSEDFTSTIAFCRELVALLTDLDLFMTRYEQGDFARH